METPSRMWEELLSNYFRVPGSPSVYVLGCFASQVTIYAQQVRALNFATALKQTASIRPEAVVGIVGAGAAGLMAAAVAANCGAKVVLLDEAPFVMSAQRNSRQRFVHPHIDNWPGPGAMAGGTPLPFFPWRAAYANEVVAQIEHGWRHVLNAYSGHSIQAHMGVSKVALVDSTSSRPLLTWRRANVDQQARCDVVILAVGFGSEDYTARSLNYWDDDSLDGQGRDHLRTLVSGVGDGGLSDFMRASIWNYRADRMWEPLELVSGIHQLGAALLRIDRSDLSEAAVDTSFRQVVSVFQGLKPLASWFQAHAKTNCTVYIASRSGLLYGRKASLLNRVLVSQVMTLPFVSFVPHAVDIATGQNDSKSTLVAFGERAPIEVDRYIARHGPMLKDGHARSWPRDLKSRGVAIAAFPEVDARCEALAANWAKLAASDDRSCQPMWHSGDFADLTVPRV